MVSSQPLSRIQSLSVTSRYTPVLDINDEDVYFPDGTFCHSQDGTDYFCRNHQCLSSDRGARSEKVPDLNFNSNARPDGTLNIPSDAEAYFSLDSNVRNVQH